MAEYLGFDPENQMPLYHRTFACCTRVRVQVWFVSKRGRNTSPFSFPQNHIVFFNDSLCSQLQNLLIYDDQVSCSVAAAPIVLDYKFHRGVDINTKRYASLHICALDYPPQGGPLVEPKRGSSTTLYLNLDKRSSQSSVFQQLLPNPRSKRTCLIDAPE